jgi:predicted dehydrogenase
VRPRDDCTERRVGIVGLGRLGKRHAENLALRVPGAEVVAACSPDVDERAWATQHLGIGNVYADYAQLLAHPGLDTVFLVTPNTLHPGQIIAGLKAGKHVFCEKPLSLLLDECLAVEAEAKRHPKLKAMVGFTRRFDPSLQDAQKKIAAGTIGRPFLVRTQSCDMNDPSGFFVRFAPKSGGIFLDMSVHDIDISRWLLGAPKPKRVFSVGTIAVHKGLAECGDVDNGIAVSSSRAGRWRRSTRRARGAATRRRPGRRHDGRLSWAATADQPRQMRARHPPPGTPTFGRWTRSARSFPQAALHDSRQRPLHDATEATGSRSRCCLVEARSDL